MFYLDRIEYSLQVRSRKGSLANRRAQIKHLHDRTATTALPNLNHTRLRENFACIRELLRASIYLR